VQVIPVDTSEKTSECQQQLERIMYSLAKMLHDEKVSVKSEGQVHPLVCGTLGKVRGQLRYSWQG